MKEYIERGWLLELYTMGGDESAVQNYHVPVPMILGTINVAPAADVVEVVRCKDCRYYRAKNFPLFSGDCFMAFQAREQFLKIIIVATANGRWIRRNSHEM